MATPAPVAVDAMGGDHAPGEIVAGVQLAAAAGVPCILVGDEARLGKAAPGVVVVHAPDVIDFHDDPARAVRARPDSSVARCARLVREGEACGFFSAGATGASMAAALLIVGRIKGIARPGIATLLPTPTGFTVLIDSGATADCKPENLAQFAVMGSAFAQVRLGLPSPRVGLLNIGEEEGKGNELARAAFDAIKAVTGINFVGNVEGRDLLTGDVDVVVTDGFTGNVSLKLAEGTATVLLRQVRDVLTSSVKSKLAALLVRNDLRALGDRMDPERVGGALLLGVDGLCVIGHGASSARAVANGVELAWRCAEAGLVADVADRLARAGRGGRVGGRVRVPAETHQHGRAADRDAVRALVREVVADVAGIEPGDVADDAALSALGVADLVLIEVQDLLLEELGERTIGLDFDSPDFATVETVDDLVTYVCEQLDLSDGR